MLPNKAKVTTTVRLDIDLYLKAKKRRLNISEIANAGLRAVVGSSGPQYDELMASALAARDAGVEAEVKSATESIRSQTQESLTDLRSAFEKYVSGGEKPLEAKLAWVGERKRRFTHLSGWSDAVLLANLESPLAEGPS